MMVNTDADDDDDANYKPTIKEDIKKYLEDQVMMEKQPNDTGNVNIKVEKKNDAK